MEALHLQGCLAAPTTLLVPRPPSNSLVVGGGFSGGQTAVNLKQILKDQELSLANVNNSTPSDFTTATNKQQGPSNSNSSCSSSSRGGITGGGVGGYGRFGSSKTLVASGGKSTAYHAWTVGVGFGLQRCWRASHVLAHPKVCLFAKVDELLITH